MGEKYLDCPSPVAHSIASLGHMGVLIMGDKPFMIGETCPECECVSKDSPYPEFREDGTIDKHYSCAECKTKWVASWAPLGKVVYKNIVD